MNVLANASPQTQNHRWTQSQAELVIFSWSSPQKMKEAQKWLCSQAGWLEWRGKGISYTHLSSCKLTSQGRDSFLSGGVSEGHEQPRGQSATLMECFPAETGVEVKYHTVCISDIYTLHVHVKQKKMLSKDYSIQRFETFVLERFRLIFILWSLPGCHMNRLDKYLSLIHISEPTRH